MKELEKELHRLYVKLNNSTMFNVKFKCAKRIHEIEEYLKWEKNK